MLLALALLASPHVLAGSLPPIGARLIEEQLVPKGWVLVSGMEKTMGDLNGDAKADLALPLQEGSGKGLNRALLVAFADTGGKFRVAEVARRALPVEAARADEEEDHTKIEILPKKGVLVLVVDGGGEIRNESKYKFRWKKNAFVLIGTTHQAYATGTSCASRDCRGKSVDTNYSTGKYEISEGQETKTRSLKKAGTVKLSEFDIDSFNEDHVGQM